MRPIPDGVDSTAEIAALMRVLRRHADSASCRRLVDGLRELAQGGRESLSAFEEGSPERHTAAVLVVVHEQLAAIVLDIYLEIGTARLDAARWAADVTPEDFGDSSW